MAIDKVNTNKESSNVHKEEKKKEFDNTSIEIYLKKKRNSNRAKKAYEQSISYYISNESNRHNSLYVKGNNDNKIKSKMLGKTSFNDEDIYDDEIDDEEKISNYYICYNKTAIEILLYEIYNHGYIIKEGIIDTIVFNVDFNKYINILKNEEKTIVVEAYGLFDGIQKNQYELKRLLGIQIGNKLDNCLEKLRTNEGFNKLLKYFD
ncbi:MAG: hypothetical protein RR646_03680 [Erysipelotrichaceae bacterium]